MKAVQSISLLAKRMKPRVFIILLGLVWVLAQPYAPSLALAQRTVKGQLKAQRLPSTEIAPPKARLHGAKRSPSDPHELYSATAKGLQKSEDGGLSWESLAVAGTHEEVFALTVHPFNPGTLFVGRRDGLWKSRDGGQSWSALPYPPSVPLAVAIAKSEPDLLYLATSRRGVHKSNDGGYQWVEVSNGLPEARVGGRPEEIRTLVVDPSDFNTVYAALRWHGVYRTIDSGGSWQPFNQGLPFLRGGPIRSPKLAFDSDDPQRLYLAFNQRIHSHLTRTRLYVLSDNKGWLPLGVRLPANFPVLDLIMERTLSGSSLYQRATPSHNDM
jgi:hypothetical protein